MVRTLLTLVFITALLTSCNHHAGATINHVCADSCMAKGKTQPLACALNALELRKRKETVIASLKNQVLEKKELHDGYAFKFTGNDKMVDQLTEFMKSERECCNFFTFTLSVSGDKSEAWLALTGPAGTKLFIESEVGL